MLQLLQSEALMANKILPFTLPTNLLRLKHLKITTSQLTIMTLMTVSLNIFINLVIAKSKRRSKNDVDGRDFKCKYCDKTYLSYPALYTHMKQKHSKGPDGEVRTPPTSGRGRGRPRKNVSALSSLIHPL